MAALELAAVLTLPVATVAMVFTDWFQKLVNPEEREVA